MLSDHHQRQRRHYCRTASIGCCCYYVIIKSDTAELMLSTKISDAGNGCSIPVYHLIEISYKLGIESLDFYGYKGDNGRDTGAPITARL